MRLTRSLGALVVIGSVLGTAPECEAKTRGDWSQVEGIERNRRMRIEVYDDIAPKGMRKSSGRFVSATADSVTIVPQDGDMRSFQKSEVRKVRVRQPVLKRARAWGLTAAATGAMFAIIFVFQDHTPLGGTWFGDETARGFGFIVAPAWAASALGLSHRTIYSVPPSARLARLDPDRN